MKNEETMRLAFEGCIKQLESLKRQSKESGDACLSSAVSDDGSPLKRLHQQSENAYGVAVEVLKRQLDIYDKIGVSKCGRCGCEATSVGHGYVLKNGMKGLVFFCADHGENNADSFSEGVFDLWSNK